MAQATFATVWIRACSVVSQSIDKDFLLLTDLSDMVDISSDAYHLEYSESFSRAFLMTENFYAYVTLDHAFNEIFFSSNYKSCLLTIGVNTVAIFMPFPDVFKIFDSHSQDLHGMPCPSGYSCFNFTREDRRAQRKNESSDQREKRLAKLKEIEKRMESSQEREKNS